MIPAEDLPYDVKLRLLAELKDKLGASGVDRMVRRFGEDGMVDLVLKALAEGSGGSPRSSIWSPRRSLRPPNAWLAALGFVARELGAGGWWRWLLLPTGRMGWMGVVLYIPILVGILLAAALFYQICIRCRSMPALAAACGKVGNLVLLAGA